MRADLLDAQACVDWTISQVDVLKRQLMAWDEQPPYRIVSEPHTQVGKKVLRLRDVKPPSPIINAQVGAMINSLRASLDLLVNRLAERTGHAGKEDSHFPICPSRDAFFIGKHAGHKHIRRLSDVDRKIIEELEPWRGGKIPLLYALHELDITRKHRRLINVEMRPVYAKATGLPPDEPVTFHAISGVKFEENAILGVDDAEPDYSKIEIVFDIRLNEAGPLANAHVTIAIESMAHLVTGIIGKFDHL